MQGAKRSAFVACADTWLGIYAARALLKAGSFSKVTAGVFNKHSEHSRTLQREGANVCEWDVNNVESIVRAMQGCDCAVVIPVPAMSIKEATCNIIAAAEKAGVTDCILWGGLEVHAEAPGSGPIERGREICKMLKAVEEKFHASKIPNKATARLAFPIQALFFLSDVIQDKAILPMATGSGKYAPVNLKDVATATSTILAKGFPPEYRNQTFTLTGPQLITSEDLAAAASKVLNAKIQYKDMSIAEFADLLQKLVQAGEMTEFEKDILVYRNHCVREGKAQVKTDDLKKLLGTEPTALERFFEENSNAFRPGKARKADRWLLSDACF